MPVTIESLRLMFNGARVAAAQASIGINGRVLDLTEVEPTAIEMRPADPVDLLIDIGHPMPVGTYAIRVELTIENVGVELRSELRSTTLRHEAMEDLRGRSNVVQAS